MSSLSCSFTTAYSQKKQYDTYFAVTVPFKLLEFKEQYNGVCKATSNFGNTGKEKQDENDDKLAYSDFILAFK